MELQLYIKEEKERIVIIIEERDTIRDLKRKIEANTAFESGMYEITVEGSEEGAQPLDEKGDENLISGECLCSGDVLCIAFTKKYLLAEMKKGVKSLEDFPKWATSDIEIVEEALLQGWGWESVHQSLKDDINFVISTIHLASDWFQANESQLVTNNTNLLLNVVRRDPTDFWITCDQEDTERTFSQWDASCLDEKFWKAFISLFPGHYKLRYGELLSHHPVDAGVFSDRLIMLEAIQMGGLSLEKVASELKTDREVVLSAVSQNGLDLRYAATHLIHDRDIVISAVTENGDAYKYIVCPKLRSDHEILKKSVETGDATLQHAPVEVRGDRDLAKHCVKHDWKNFMYLSEHLQKDTDFVVWAVKTHKSLYNYLSKEVQAVSRVLCAAAKWDASLLGNRPFSDVCCADRGCMLELCNFNGRLLHYALPPLLEDCDVVLTACRQNPEATVHASRVLTGSKDFVVSCLAKLPTFHLCYPHLPPSLRADPDVTALLPQSTLFKELTFTVGNDVF